MRLTWIFHFIFASLLSAYPPPSPPCCCICQSLLCLSLHMHTPPALFPLLFYFLSFSQIEPIEGGRLSLSAPPCCLCSPFSLYTFCFFLFFCFFPFFCYSLSCLTDSDWLASLGSTCCSCSCIMCSQISRAWQLNGSRLHAPQSSQVKPWKVHSLEWLQRHLSCDKLHYNRSWSQANLQCATALRPLVTFNWLKRRA